MIIHLRGLLSFDYNRPKIEMIYSIQQMPNLPITNESLYHPTAYMATFRICRVIRGGGNGRERGRENEGER